MRLAIQIPIKKNSQRVPNKNFRKFRGKPLYDHLLGRVDDLPFRHHIYVDSESEEVVNLIASKYKFKVFKREKWFAGDNANGNHLLWNFACHNMEYTAYCQLFVTAVDLKLETINKAIETFFYVTEDGEYDSLFLATEETGFIWYDGNPVNYNPDTPSGLARSQDIRYIKETTGLYIITKEALLETGCRVGRKPYAMIVNQEEASDIDTIEDFQRAEKKWII
jgi:CMP-N-acetylneuraminic acid synthetase